ncbi:MAG: ribulokinase [Clostridia bacterium]|nr:ribulokinase [Clostridia bacterium]
MTKIYTIGIDYGTLSGRAVLVDTRDGRELATTAMDYPHGVMDTVLAASGAPLPPDFALQDPADYLLVLRHIIPEVLEKAAVSPEEVAGLCIDFTCCTVLPIRADGTPLCFEEAYKKNPHAYVKLWKHHAAQPHADRMTKIAAERGEKWLPDCGGTVSSEYLFPKLYQVLEEAPEVWQDAYTFMEAGDWLTAQLTGKYVRGYQFAAFKSHYSKTEGYPSEEYFAAVDQRLRFVVRDKLPFPVVPAGTAVGTVTPEAAASFGLSVDTMVASATPDGHVAACALDTCKAGDAVAVMGTSAPFYVLTEEKKDVPGVCGTVVDGVVPGLVGYEAGLCCFGDHFAYAAQQLTSPDYVKEAAERGIPMLKLLIEKAAAKKPGEAGVIALNWWNGNRSTLVDSDLSGLFVGMTLQTRPEDLMRALIEATAFGTRNVFENFARHGVHAAGLVASGGIARKDPFTMQLFADVLRMEIRIAETTQAPATGAAVNAAVAAGIYPTLPVAIHAMSRISDTVYRPNEENAQIYDLLYREYKKLHDYFGRGENNVMKELRRIRAAAKEI